MTKRLETARAKVGATLLDVIRPNWATEINAASLDLSDCTSCILGQLFGKYGVGAEKLFAIAAQGTYEPGQGWMDSGIEGAACRSGFVGDPTSDTRRDEEYGALTKAWKREIAKRLPKVRMVPAGKGVRCDLCCHSNCDTPVRKSDDGYQWVAKEVPAS